MPPSSTCIQETTCQIQLHGGIRENQSPGHGRPCHFINPAHGLAKSAIQGSSIQWLRKKHKGIQWLRQKHTRITANRPITALEEQYGPWDEVRRWIQGMARPPGLGPGRPAPPRAARLGTQAARPLTVSNRHNRPSPSLSTINTPLDLPCEVWISGQM